MTLLSASAEIYIYMKTWVWYKCKQYSEILIPHRTSLAVDKDIHSISVLKVYENVQRLQPFISSFSMHFHGPIFFNGATHYHLNFFIPYQMQIHFHALHRIFVNSEKGNFLFCYLPFTIKILVFDRSSILEGMELRKNIMVLCKAPDLEAFSFSSKCSRLPGLPFSSPLKIWDLWILTASMTCNLANFYNFPQFTEISQTLMVMELRDIWCWFPKDLKERILYFTSFLLKASEILFFKSLD